jgi:hypothetical protein
MVQPDTRHKKRKDLERNQNGKLELITNILETLHPLTHIKRK